MYSEADYAAIDRKIRRAEWALFPALVLLAAAYAAGFALRLRWLSTLAGILLSVAAIFGFTFVLVPEWRYRRFLMDMQSGLSRELTGTIGDISEETERQDGCRVRKVHVTLAEDGDERTVYLNASKADGFPEPGSAVRLRLYGRHIKEAERL